VHLLNATSRLSSIGVCWCAGVRMNLGWTNPKPQINLPRNRD
jgi:hypothetical protein